MILLPEDLTRCQEISEMGLGKLKPIVNAVADATGIQPWMIYGRKRTKKLSEARQLVYFLAFRAGMSLSEIGRLMNRDHTTIMHGVRQEELRRNPQVNPQANETDAGVANEG